MGGYLLEKKGVFRRRRRFRKKILWLRFGKRFMAEIQIFGEYFGGHHENFGVQKYIFQAAITRDIE